MADQAITLSVVIESLPGREEELLSKLRELVGPTRSEPGCVSYELNVSTEAAGRFLFYERFTNQEALDAHINTQHFQRFLKYRESNDPVANQTVMRWASAV